MAAAAFAATGLSPLSAPHVQAQPRTLQIAITDAGFRPQNILVALNQPLQLRVINVGKKEHQFSIPYYRIYTETLAPGRVSTIGFAPWTSGRFEYISDPAGAGGAEFTGWMTVVDATQRLK
ncbi:cupredoxin domain-containing protein [Alicyclobacillus shizuokensis]|uniref:cupredoxin domain-containing protein n=1 Tax=Alicyclobacillus shizuokensis TaxID=392014 RepID=UPI000833379D|nr:cupredoxin domain-containing protein [Alicyclobacillus shizuokensis]MCL6626193.1 cupredoxin domain-containing protein [Alicyclobacillus shizuokensis]